MKRLFLATLFLITSSLYAHPLQKWINQLTDTLPTKHTHIDTCPNFSGAWKGECFQNSFPFTTERSMEISQIGCQSIGVTDFTGHTETFVIENAVQPNKGITTANYAQWQENGSLLLLWESRTTQSTGAIRTHYDEALTLPFEDTLKSKGKFDFRSYNFDMNSSVQFTVHCTYKKQP